MVDLARKNLLHDKLRFVITVSGVAFAVTLIFVQIGLFGGLLDNASVTIDHLDADVWVTSSKTPNIDFAHLFPETSVQRVRSVPGVARADNLIVSFMFISLPNGARENIEVYALEDFNRWHFPWNVVQGNLDDLRRGRYFFLDESAARRFGPFAVGEYREVLDYRLKIIGTTREALSFTTTPIGFMDYRIAQTLLGREWVGRTTYIVAKLAPGADAKAVKAEIQRRLPHNDVYTTAEWSRQSRSYWVDSTGIGFNMFMTVLLGGLVGIVIVAQTLYTSTMEHLKEFGTVKAIGGSNGDIYKILAEQAVISAVVGYVLGLIPAFALVPAMAKGGLKLVITPELMLAVFVGTVAMCLLAAMVSFRKVATIDPALVFRG
ncbi:MAG: ABC transporter permease [Sulfuricella sp.]|nr:ABC transporter permease [Sulfuricella sp.]